MSPDRRRAARRLGGAAAEAGSVPDAVSVSSGAVGAAAAGGLARFRLAHSATASLTSRRDSQHTESTGASGRPPIALRLPCIHS